MRIIFEILVIKYEIYIRKIKDRFTNLLKKACSKKDKKKCKKYDLRCIQAFKSLLSNPL